MKINFILIILGLYPGLLLFTTETGLALRLDLFGFDMLAVVLFKWAYILIFIFSILIKKNILRIKFNHKIIFLVAITIIATYISSSNHINNLDGYYITYWIIFGVLVVDLIAYRDVSYIPLIKLLLILLFIDIIITSIYTSGGGIFHQHRFSGIFSFIITITLCNYIYFIRNNVSKFLPFILLFFSILLIYTTIYLNTTRQILPYAISSALISLSLFKVDNIIKNQLINNSMAFLFVIIGFSFLFAIIPIAHLLGFFGDIVYQLIDFSSKVRSINQEAGREFLFNSLINLVLLNDIQWISPINFSDGLTGGAVSAHNFWLQTYIQFGLLYLFLWIVIFSFLLLKIVNILRVMRTTYKLSIALLLLSHLIILSFNDEGGFYSRAPAVSLYLIVLFGLWLRIKNYQASCPYILLREN